jgi:hypothetical protein
LNQYFKKNMPLNTHLTSKNGLASPHLTCHPNTACSAVQAVQVSVGLSPQGALQLGYAVAGDLAQIAVPAPQPPVAVDGLWEHTCFEVFIAVAGCPHYREFNFSPSSQWAAYAFCGYRARSVWTASQKPRVSFAKSHDRLLLSAVIAAADLPENSEGLPFQLGLTAVIETSADNCSYWSLHHPTAQPDFHHRAGFTLTLDSI